MARPCWISVTIIGDVPETRAAIAAILQAAGVTVRRPPNDEELDAERGGPETLLSWFAIVESVDVVVVLAPTGTAEDAFIGAALFLAKLVIVVRGPDVDDDALYNSAEHAHPLTMSLTIRGAGEGIFGGGDADEQKQLVAATGRGLVALLMQLAEADGPADLLSRQLIIDGSWTRSPLVRAVFSRLLPSVTTSPSRVLEAEA
jgi:hypothetical protein